MILQQILLASLLVWQSNNRVYAVEPLKADDPRVQNEVYNFDSKTLCFTSSVKSAILDYKGKRLLVVDNGYGKWKLKDSETYVQDLNGWTAAYDITNDFDNTKIEPIWQHKKQPHREPVTNHAGIWTDATQSCFYIHGGHFYDNPSLNISEYHLSKGEYPGYEVWRFDVAAKMADPDNKDLNPWTNVSLIGAEHANRTFSGAGASVAKGNLSFWIGGITNPYTSNDSPTGVFQSTSQMIKFDAGTAEISTDQKYFTDDPTDGYWHGSLEHLPIGCEKDDPGFLISMMSQKWPLGKNGTDKGYTSDEEGEPVSFEKVWLHNVTSGKWYEQTTSWSSGDIPENRSRYCTALVHDEEMYTWDLWVLGGQRLDDRKRSTSDIWVLTMPTFEWVKLEPAATEVTWVRGHSCHAVGGQLLVLSGILPSEKPDTEAECRKPYIRILDMNSDAPGIPTSFKADSYYRSPNKVRLFAGNRYEPKEGFDNPAVKEAFARAHECRLRHGVSKPGAAAIGAGVSVGALLLIIASVLFCCYRDSRRPQPKHPKFSSIVFKTAHYNEPEYVPHPHVDEKAAIDAHVQSLPSPTSPSVAGTEPSQFLTAGPGSTVGVSSVAGGMSTVNESARASNIDEERPYETGPARETVSPSETVESPVPPTPTRSPILDESNSRPVPSDNTREDYARGGL